MSRLADLPDALLEVIFRKVTQIHAQIVQVKQRLAQTCKVLQVRVFRLNLAVARNHFHRAPVTVWQHPTVAKYIRNGSALSTYVAHKHISLWHKTFDGYTFTH